MLPKECILFLGGFFLIILLNYEDTYDYTHCIASNSTKLDKHIYLCMLLATKPILILNRFDVWTVVAK